MRKIVIGASKRIIMVAAFLVIAVAILISIARVFTPMWAHNQQQVARVISDALHTPVKVGHIAATWHVFQPMFRLDDVEFLSPETQKTAIKIDRIFVGVNIFKSILHRQFEPGTLIIAGATLSVTQNAQGEFVIVGINNEQTNDGQYSLSALSKWLVQQHRIELQDITLFIQHANGEKDKAFVNISFRSESGRARIKGTTSLSGGQLTSKLNFLMNVQGDFSKPKGYRAKFYISGTNLNLKKWLNHRAYKQIRLTHGNLDVELWGTVKDGILSSLTANLGLNNLQLNHDGSQQALNLKRVSGELLWKFSKGKEWVLTTKAIKILGQVPWPNEQLTLKGNAQGDIKLYLQYLPMKAVTELAAFFGKTTVSNNNLLTHLKPTGNIEHAVVEFNRSNDSLTLQHYSFLLRDLSWQPWQQIPGVQQIRALLAGDSTTTNVELLGQQVQLNFPTLYDKPLNLSNLSIKANWQQSAKGGVLSLPEVILQTTPNDKLNVHGKLTFNQQQSPVVDLAGEFNTEAVTPELLRTVLPKKILDPTFMTWMTQSMKAGGPLQGQLLWRGPLDKVPYDDHSGVLTAQASFSDLNLQFDPDWPQVNHLKGNMEFSGRQLVIQANEADSLGVTINGVTATIPYLGDARPAVLNITGSAQSAVNVGVNYLMHSPVQEVLGKDFSKMTSSGAVAVQLGLHIPLSSGSSSKVTFNADATLSNASLTLPFNNLKVAQINGLLQATQQGVTAKNITAQFLNRPIAVQITSDTRGREPKLTIQANGQATVSDVSRLINYPLDNYATGSFDYVTKIGYSHDGDITATVSSDLKNTVINVPKPFLKPSAQSIPTEVAFHNMKGQQYGVTFHYGTLVAGDLSFNAGQTGWVFNKGHVHFGVGQANMLASQKLLIDGVIPSLSIAEWKPFVSAQLPAKSATTSNKEPSAFTKLLLESLHLTIAELNVYDNYFKNVTVSVEPEPEQFLMTVSGDSVDGTIYLPHDPNNRLAMQLTKLYWQPSAAKTAPSQPVDNATLLNMPPLLIHCSDFRYGDRQFGNVGIQTSKTPQGLIIDKFVAFNKSYAFNAKGSWLLVKGQQQSQLSGVLTATSVSDMLKQWQVPSSLHGNKAQINFNLSWPGSPMTLTGKGVNGELNLRMGQGYISGLSSSTNAKMGFGRLLNLLSLQSLPRRLTLNFSDLVHKGFYFDKFVGDWKVRDGNAETRDTYLDGSVAYVALNGAMNLNNRTYNLRLIVAPHLTSSIPLVATIAGGPIVGGVAWAVNKLITPEVQRIAHYTYSVKGSWDNPEINSVK